ncbi:MAG: hypothetical protein E2O39_07080 [Planctomycetota bacterium]|nr:MAG: hypothetical protein E2O39_07080 [Planctomycetota bacterium]
MLSQVFSPAVPGARRAGECGGQAPLEVRSLLATIAFSWLWTCPALAAVDGADAGEEGGPGLAIYSSKILTAVYGGQSVVDTGVVLVKDGKIEAVGPRRDITVPEGYEELDLGRQWLMPGMIDLHCHVAGSIRDLNDMVFLTNPGLRASPTVTPRNRALDRGIAGGVTSVLLIPGSGTNMGGQGILLRTGFDTYEENLLRNPGSLKLAQAGNPERWVMRPQRSFMNWNTRNTFRRGLTYAARMKAAEDGDGPLPERDIQFDVFRDLLAKKTQVSTHTQIYQVVLMTLTMVREEFGLDVYIDHGTFDGYRAAAHAERIGVPAILGPRQMQAPRPPFIDTDGRINGVAAMYQEGGHTMVGFNTDCVGFGGIGQEELSLQSAMGVRYGFDNSEMDAVRGITIVPAKASGLDDRLGSIEVGKDADLIVVTGDPCDPRTSVELVFLKGRKVYDTSEDTRRF